MSTGRHAIRRADRGVLVSRCEIVDSDDEVRIVIEITSLYQARPDLTVCCRGRAAATVGPSPIRRRDRSRRVPRVRDCRSRASTGQREPRCCDTAGRTQVFPALRAQQGRGPCALLRAVRRELGPDAPCPCTRLRCREGRRVCAWRRRASRTRCFAAPGSADRPRSRARRAPAARRHAREPDRPPALRRANTTADADARARLPARSPERDGDRRMSSSSSQSQTRRRSVRSPTSRCRRAHATAANDASATPPLRAAPAHAEPRPPIGRQRGYGRRATASGGRRGRSRAQTEAGLPRLTRLPRSQRPAQAARQRRLLWPQQRLATVDGTAGDARSSD
jgi:hypothetical protein